MAFCVIAITCVAARAQCSGDACDYLKISQRNGCIVLRNIFEDGPIKVVESSVRPQQVRTVYGLSEVNPTAYGGGVCYSKWISRWTANFTGERPQPAVQPLPRTVPRNPNNPPITTGVPETNQALPISVRLNCDRPGMFAFRFKNQVGIWETAGWYRVEANSSVVLPLRTDNPFLYFVGRLMGGGVYDGSQDPEGRWYDVLGEPSLFRSAKPVFRSGTHQLILSCNRLPQEQIEIDATGRTARDCKAQGTC